MDPYGRLMDDLKSWNFDQEQYDELTDLVASIGEQFKQKLPRKSCAKCKESMTTWSHCHKNEKPLCLDCYHKHEHICATCGDDELCTELHFYGKKTICRYCRDKYW